jgi:hypothetical protein
MHFMHPVRSPATPREIFTGVPLIQDVPESDNYRHPPGKGDDEWYQESWAVCWYDPVVQVAGYQHFGLQHRRGLADLWSTLIYKGQVRYHHHSITLPLPQTDYDDMRVGPLRVVCEQPLMRHRIIEGDDKASCNVVYEAYFAPCRYDLDFEGAACGKGHYENFGRVRGTFNVDGATIEVNGYGYHDHSWGRRDWGEIVSFRNMQANFGPDFCVYILDMISDKAGRTAMGYIYKDGVFHSLSRVDGRTGVADDGHSPASYEAYAWTNDGFGGLHIVGESQAYNIDAHMGYFQTNGHMVWRSGGRLGAGWTDLRELGNPAAWHRRYFGME